MSDLSNFCLAKVPKQLALLGLVGASVSLLASCGHGSNDYVNCTGVALKGEGALNIDAGICKKLAGGKGEALTCTHWGTAHNNVVQCTDPHSTLTASSYSIDQYVKCYGVAAASMNDCGTPTTACGGSVHTARSKVAWIAIPQGICERIKGSVVGKMKQ